MYEILFSQTFIRKQFEHAEPLEFLNLSTGFTQVKYGMLNQWPLVSDDLDDDSELIQSHGDIQITVNQAKLVKSIKSIRN